MRLGLSNDERIDVRFLVFFLCVFGNVFPENSRNVGAEIPKGCAHLRCKRGETCVSRKFWCKSPPCPSMLYCSKSRKESLKGPSSCEAVRCSKGFVCLARARHCRWDQGCRQRIARCISERDYYEGPASCFDFECPPDERCILRESLCATAPCKLLKSCANARDVRMWHEACKNLGCLSEHECFLRRPEESCVGASCNHNPDCSVTAEEDPESREQCRGWVCPKGRECSSHTRGPCKRENCRISRSCHEPLMIPVNATPSARHSWRDDATPSFRRDSPPFIFRRNDRTNSIKSPDTSNERIDQREMYDSANSRPAVNSSSESVSGRVVEPTAVTSLAAWLNHLKLLTSADAVQPWIEKADGGDNPEGFLEWLESVKDALGSAAYDLWLEEVRAMTVTNQAFQKWLPASPTNRVVPGANYGSLEIPPGLKNLTRNAGSRETTTRESVPTHDSPIVPPTTATIGINDWSRLNSLARRIFRPGYSPAAVPAADFGNVETRSNVPLPYPAFVDAGLPNPSYPELSSNWSLQRPLDYNPFFLGPKNWLDQFLNSAHPEWQREINFSDEIFPDPSFFDSRDDPSSIYPPPMEDPARWYPRNSTPLVSPHNFESYRITDGNFVDPNWLGSGYPWRSLPDEPRHRSKHDDAARDYPYDETPSLGLAENWTGPTEEKSNPGYPGYLWKIMDPETREYYSRLAEWYAKNLYDGDNNNNKKDGSPAGPTLSRIHPLEPDDPSVSLENPYFFDKRSRLPQSEYPWTVPYSYDKFYHVPPAFPPSFPIPSLGPPEILPRISPSVKSNPSNRENQPIRSFLIGDRVNDDVPGRSMDLPNLWNSRYRNPPSPYLRKIIREEFGNRGTLTRNRPSSTASPATQASPKKTVTPRRSIGENVGKKSRDYWTEEDDGVYPLLLSLQGYVESPLNRLFPDSWKSLRNFTILPVYTIDNADDTQQDYEAYEALDDGDGTNFVRDKKYTEISDFSDNLKNMVRVEAALIIENRTGNGEIEVEDTKWEYEDAADSTGQDLPEFRDKTRTPERASPESWKRDPMRDWVIDKSGAWEKERSPTDYYDDRIDYVEETTSGDGNYFSPDQRNIEDIPGKRFKKNRPL